MVNLPPIRKCNHSGQQHQHQKRRCNAIGQDGQAGLFGGRLFHQRHDLRETGVTPQLVYTHFHRAGKVETACNQRFASHTGDRVRFAGEQGLVYGNPFAQQFTITRKCLTCLDPHHITHGQPAD